MEKKIIDDDIVQVHRYENEASTKDLIATLMWGDEVRVTGQDAKNYILDWAQQVWEKQADGISRPYWEFFQAAIPIKTKLCNSSAILKVRIVDVGQGDAAIIETPAKKMIIVDGGQNEALRQYMQRAYSHVLREGSIGCEAVVITHGDEDHIVGLHELLSKKRFDQQNHLLNEPMVKAERIYHNGLVKRANKGSDDPALFGIAKTKDGKTYIQEIVKDPRDLPDAVLPKIMQDWKKVLTFQQKCNPNLDCKNLLAGDDQAFQFTENEGISIEVLGPLAEAIDGEKLLPWLHKSPTGKSLSGSHTINGNSVILKLEYDKVRILFGADLNRESELHLMDAYPKAGGKLQAEVLKAPHHGSDDYIEEFFDFVQPVVSVISSGDEDPFYEHIHPRACLVGTLGKYSRPNVTRPLIFVTEMSAFFEKIGIAFVTKAKKVKGVQVPDTKTEYLESQTYKKTCHGIVHIRTDGKRVLVAAHSAKPGLKEKYVFTVDKDHNIDLK
jgi:ribonuclease BN (tRNA processing enzyme)